MKIHFFPSWRRESGNQIDTHHEHKALEKKKSIMFGLFHISL